MALITSSGFKITAMHWFSPGIGPQIGIITGKSSHGEIKRYIGTAFGGSEGQDAIFISGHGAPFYGNPTSDPTRDIPLN